MAGGGIGWHQNIEARSLSQSICGSGLVAIDSAGSSAPYSLAMEARSFIALTPAALLMGHLPDAANQLPPAPTRIGLNCTMVHCGACMANLKPCRVKRLPSLIVSRLATSPNFSQLNGASRSGSRPTEAKCLVLR